jgi:hypothetical protein
VFVEAQVKALFDRYERSMNQALAGKPDLEEAAAFYAPAYVAASPAGIMTGKNDAALKQVMEQGYAHYRSIGTKEMRIRNVRISPIDDHHCMAHVAWTATYARKEKPDVTIDFDVHYLVQQLGGAPKIFGWISGDEEAVLKQHGIG